MAKPTQPTPVKPITDRIKTMAHVLKANGLTKAAFTASCKGLEPDEVAYREAKLIAAALNEGTVMSIADTDQWKYFPWFRVEPKKAKKGVPTGFGLSCYVYDNTRTYANIGARLAFKTAALARYAGGMFPDVYVRFFS